METPQAREQAIFLQQIRQPLTSEQGRALIEYLEALYCERRTVVHERTPSGPASRLARLTSYSDNPYETARNEGRREVVLFLKDLRDLES